MSSHRDSTITSYFVPKGDVKKTSKATRPISPPPTTRPSHEEKGKGKRPMSSSPASIPSKRQDTKLTTTITSTPRHLSHKDLPSNWLATPSPSTPGPQKLSLTYHNGSIFAAPPQTLLIHACNTQGAWGSGIALAFKSAYPRAYAIYHSFCTREHLLKSRPVPTGTALLIPPVDGGKGGGHWIGCLFTSARYGKGKDKPDTIVRNTAPAMQMLLELVQKAKGEGQGEGIETVRMCRINSGKFGVTWERTEEALEGIKVAEGWKGVVEVWDPET